MSNLKSRINKLVKSIGLGEPFREGVRPGDHFSRYYFRRGQDHSNAPVGYKRAAVWVGLVMAATALYRDHFKNRQDERNQRYREKARAILGLTCDESADVVVARCIELGRQAGMNVAELAKVESSISGIVKSIASDP